MGDSSPTPQKINVRNIISIFENQTIPTNNESSNLRRAQSLPRLDHKPRSTNHLRATNLEHEQISQQIQHLKKNLDNYRSYSRENHVYYQNQIVFILTDVANINCEPELRMELAERLKTLNKTLNFRLPAAEGVTNRFEPKRPKSVGQKKAKETVEAPKNEDKEDTPVSVQSLKQLFEKNANENNAKREFTKTNISRSMTFNSTSDFKYIPYGENHKNGILKKQVSFNDKTSESVDGKVMFRQVTVSEELSPEEVSNEESDQASENSGSEDEGF